MPATLEPASTWAVDVLWERSVTSKVSGSVVGIVRTPDAIMTFMTNGMVRTSLSGENAIESLYEDGMFYESVIQGVDSAVALIGPEAGQLGHRLCHLSLDGVLHVSACLALPNTFPIPDPPRWNGNAFQVLSRQGDDLVLQGLTAEGLVAEDKKLAPLPEASSRHDAIPLGNSQFLTMTGKLGEPICRSAWGQAIPGNQGTPSKLNPSKSKGVRLWKAYSPNEVFLLHSSRCVPDTDLCSRSEGDDLFFSSRIHEDGAIVTSPLPQPVYGTTEVIWDEQSFVAVTHSTNRLTAYIFGDDDTPLEGVVSIPSADVSSHPIVVANAPRDFLIAFRALTGGHRLMRVKVRPQ